MVMGGNRQLYRAIGGYGRLSMVMGGLHGYRGLYMVVGG